MVARQSPVARIPHHPPLAQSHPLALFSPPPPPQVEELDRVRCKDAHRWAGTVVEQLLAPIILGIMELVRLPSRAPPRAFINRIIRATSLPR